MRAAIFIDGGYLLKQVQEARVFPDYPKLVNYFLEPLRRSTALDLMRCYFYYCPPWMSQHPTDDEKRRMAQYGRFVSEIEDIERWQFREGKLEKRREGDRDVYSQKRVDVLLSVDMVRHAAAGHVQHAVLVAGDSDFIPAVQAVKDSGVTVTLWCGSDRSPHKELMIEADDVQFLDFRRFPKLLRAAEPGGGDLAQQELAASEGHVPAKKTTGRAPRARKQEGPKREASPKREVVAKVETPPKAEIPAKRDVAAKREAPVRESAPAAAVEPNELIVSDEDASPKKKTRRGRRGGRGRKKNGGTGSVPSPNGGQESGD